MSFGLELSFSGKFSELLNFNCSEGDQKIISAGKVSESWSKIFPQNFAFNLRLEEVRNKWSNKQEARLELRLDIMQVSAQQFGTENCSCLQLFLQNFKSEWNSL